MKFHTGDQVKWAWGNGEGVGKIQEGFTRKVTRKIKGTEVVRNGSEEDPAYLIEQDDGDEVLKLESELEKG